MSDITGLVTQVLHWFCISYATLRVGTFVRGLRQNSNFSNDWKAKILPPTLSLVGSLTWLPIGVHKLTCLYGAAREKIAIKYSATGGAPLSTRGFQKPCRPGTFHMHRSSISRVCIYILSVVAVVWTGAVPAVQAPALSVYAKRLNSTGELQRVDAGANLATGDAISIRVRTVERAYVYVIAVGASGSAVLLQPFSERPEEALMSAQMRRSIPGDDALLPLDRHVGNETLIAVATPTPVRDPRAMLLEIESRAARGGVIEPQAFADFGEASVFVFRHAPVAEILSEEPRAPRPVLFANSGFEAGVLSESGSRIRALLDGVPAQRTAPQMPATTPSATPQGLTPPASSKPLPSTSPEPQKLERVTASSTFSSSLKKKANAKSLSTTVTTSNSAPAETSSDGQIADNVTAVAAREDSGPSWFSRLFRVTAIGDKSTTSATDVASASSRTSTPNISADRPARAQALNVTATERVKTFETPRPDVSRVVSGPTAVRESPMAPVTTSAPPPRFSPVSSATPALKPLALTPAQALVELDPSADDGASAAMLLLVTPAATGSALLVDDEGHLLTTWHLVRGFSRVTVWPKAPGQALSDTATPRFARVVRANRNSDLALLVIEGAVPDIEPLELAEEAALKRGEVVHVLGHDNGDRWTHVLARHVRRKARHSWITQGRFVHRETVLSNQAVGAPDTTGGALLNSQMQLVGLNVQVGRKSGQLYSVAVDRIRRFLSGELGTNLSPSG